MRATENQSIRSPESIGESFVYINASHLLGDRMLYPSFLDQRNQQRTSLFPSRKPMRFKRLPVSMAADSRLSAHHDYLLVRANRSRSLCTRLDHTNHWNMRRRSNAIQSQ